jgi:acid phosphatase
MRQMSLVVLLALLVAGCGGSTPTQHAPAPPTAAATTAPTPPRPSSRPASAAHSPGNVPRFAHIVVVVEENHAAGEVLGSGAAPYLDALAAAGVRLADSHGVTHPSEPNYLALFSGSTQGLTDDSCPHRYSGASLAAQLRAAGQTFAGYADGLPSAGYLGCSAGAYARKHAPWTDFANLPVTVNQPFTAFPSDYARLPRLAFVVPDLDHDMHDGTIGQADAWLRTHLGGYVSWARAHDSLLIVTWDEDDGTAGNHIPGLFAGAHLRPGRYAARVDHYTMLRTIEAACGLPPLGRAAHRAPITGVWAG